MAKIYGESDAVTTFLDRLNGHFKIVELDSFEDFLDFSQNPLQDKKDFIEGFEHASEPEIIDLNNRIAEIKIDIDSLKKRIQTINYQLKKKYVTIKKVGGKLKHQIQDEISNLDKERKLLEISIVKLQKEIKLDASDLEDCRTEKAEILKNLDNDISKFDKLSKHKNYKIYLQGAWGEYKLIALIEDAFKRNKEFYLINAFDLDIVGRALNYKNHTLVEDKIDHILICPKGIFIIETKAWKTIFKPGIEKVVDQLNKTKLVFHSLFQHIIPQELIEILLISTEKSIILPEKVAFKSIDLNSLKDYIVNKKACLTEDQIILILNYFLPHLTEHHMGVTSKLGIKFRGLLAKMRQKK